MRYNLCVDCMPCDDLPELDPQQTRRVLSAALSTLHQQARHGHGAPGLGLHANGAHGQEEGEGVGAGMTAAADQLVSEVQLDFQRTLNKM
jgi:hypothetical protein